MCPYRSLSSPLAENSIDALASRNCSICSIVSIRSSFMLITILRMINPRVLRLQNLRLRLIPRWKYRPRSGSHLIGQGCHAFGHAARREVEVFQNARTRPVDVRAVLEDDVDEGGAEKGEATHDLGFRHREHRGCERVGDLVLDHLRRLAGVLG